MEEKKLKVKLSDNGLYGYVDEKGNWVIPAQFDDAWDFEEGLARVKKNNKQGFIKPDGSYLIEPIFQFAWDFENGLSYFRIKDIKQEDSTKDGVLKSDGSYFIEPIYDSIGYYFDEKGNYSNGLKFKDGLIHVTLGGKRSGKESGKRKEGWIREDGTFLLPPEKYTYCGPFNNGFCKLWSNDNEKYGVFSREGHVVAEPQFDSVTFLGNGLIIVENDDKCGLMNKDGKLVLPLERQDIQELNNGWMKFRLKDKDKYGIVSAEGVLKEPQFDWVDKFQDNVLLVKIDDLYGYLKSDGSFLIEPKFVEASPMSDGRAEVKEGCRSGIAFADGSVKFEKGIFRKQGDNEKWGFVDENGNWVIEPKFEKAWDFSYEDKESSGKFSESFAWVKINGKWQLIDKNGSWAIGPGDKLDLFKGENNKWGMKVSTTGKIIFTPQYEEAFGWEDFIITTNEHDTVDIFTPEGLLEESFCDASVEDEYNRLVIWQNGEEWHFYPDGTANMAVMEDDEDEDDEEYDEDED